MSSVIKIENLWKEYRLGVIGHGTLTHDLQSWWAKVRGKEDPNTKISPRLAGQEKQIEGDHFWALRDINFEVKQGGVLGIIGGNGAGKSTLLKILSRVTAPSKGNIKVKGRISSLLEVGTGFHPELTGRENIFMNGAILGMSKGEIRSKLEEIIDFSGIEDFVDTPVKRYSSGMYVRLAFAVAAHLEPDILVVDEVLAVGDAEFQKKAIGKMQDLSTGTGRTVIFVSHNMNSISRLCDKAMLLTNGQIATQGATDSIIKYYINQNAESYKTMAEFPVNPSKDINILEAKLEDENGEVIPDIYDVNKPFFINFKIKLTAFVKRSSMMVYFKNSRDEFVLLSDRLDNPANVIPQKKGTYEIRIEVEQPLLKPDRYYLTIGSTNKDNDQSNHFYSILNFELKDFTGIRPDRSGYIYKPLSWEVNKVTT